MNNIVGTTVNGFYIEDCVYRANKKYSLVICPYCKSKTWKRYDSLKRIYSCGCINRSKNHFKPLEITGQKFGRLTAIRSIEKVNNKYTWEFLCDCGKTIEREVCLVTKGRITSCGCLRKELTRNQTELANNVFREKCIIDGCNEILLKRTEAMPFSTTNEKNIHRKRDKYRVIFKIKGETFIFGNYFNIEDAIPIRNKVRDILSIEGADGVIRFHKEFKKGDGN